MTDEKSTTLDYIDEIVVRGEVFREPANEYWALMCQWQGMEYLNSQVLKCEQAASDSINSGEEHFFSSALGANIKANNLMLFGEMPEAIQGETKLLTIAFHWYAISACQYVRLVGAIAKRLDDTRPLPHEYAKLIIPEVIVFRDKVAAHFSWSSMNNRDNDAERLSSILPPLSYNRGRICVGTMKVLLQQDGKSSDSSEIKEWSISEVHERLKNRYLPPSADTKND